MSDIVMQVENLSKLYRLGQVGTGTLSHDLNRWWHRIRGKEDPYKKVGSVNDRASAEGGDYVWALQNVSFEVRRGDVVGIIGKNGAGKSTLLKLLSQVTAPTEGSIRVKGRISSLLEVGTGFHPELTGRENIYLNGAILGMTRAEITKKFDEIVAFSGVAKYVDTPVKRYSSGMMVRLGFAVAAHLESEILIVDEVLAVGDAEFQEKCLGKIGDISQSGRTVLFVSHQMQSVNSLCNRAMLLKKGGKEAEGEVSEIINMYAREKRNNFITYPSGPVKDAKVWHDKDGIHVVAHYRMRENQSTPNFGFVVFDPLGNPIVGNHLINMGLPVSKSYPKEGQVTIDMENPRLVNGTYRVGIWFGDGFQNMFRDNESLELRVVGEERKTLAASKVGFVYNDCKFRVE